MCTTSLLYVSAPCCECFTTTTSFLALFIVCACVCVCVCEYWTNCTHGLILKSPVGSFQALWHSFPSLSQVQVGPLSAVPRHSLVPQPSASLTPNWRHIQTDGGGGGDVYFNVCLNSILSVGDWDYHRHPEIKSLTVAPKCWRTPETRGHEKYLHVQQHSEE